MNVIPEEWKSLKDLDYLKLLINPQFINIEGLIIINAHYNPITFSKNWILIIKNNQEKIEKIENTINHVHFSSFTDDVSMQETIGKYVSNIWSEKLKKEFPNTDFEMPFFFNDNEWELGLWVNRLR